MVLIPEVDTEGFLRDHGLWNEEVACAIADAEGISLSEEHWSVIRLVRSYYEQYRLFPQNRVLVNRIGECLGQDKGTSIYFMMLFTSKPARTLAKIAGLPKPPNCD